MGILANYIKLEDGQTEVLHFKGHELQERLIRDPLTSTEKTVRVLVMFVDQRGGAAVDTIFSIVSDKLATQFGPFLERERYKNYLFAITRRGKGFTTDWEIQATPSR